MLDFLADFGNYASRKVARYDGDGFFISTARCSDGSQPYETAIRHPLYNNDNIVIVEAYDTEDEAQAGHQRWVRKFTEGKLPNELVDCANSSIQQLIGKETFPKRGGACAVARSRPAPGRGGRLVS